jgi:hypothetical protein
VRRTCRRSARRADPASGLLATSGRQDKAKVWGSAARKTPRPGVTIRDQGHTVREYRTFRISALCQLHHQRRGRTVCPNVTRWRWHWGYVWPATCWRCTSDDTLCVKAATAAAPRQHVVPGTQRANMRRMACTRRGGERPVIRREGRGQRRARSVALREAVALLWLWPPNSTSLMCAP